MELEVTKKKRFNGIYAGMEVDIEKDVIARPMVVIEVSMNKINYELGYNINDNELRAGIKFRIGK